MKRPCIHILRHWREVLRWGQHYLFSTEIPSTYQVDLIVQSRRKVLAFYQFPLSKRTYKYELSGNMQTETKSWRGGTPPAKFWCETYPSDGVVYMAYRKYRFTSEEPPEWTVLIDKR